MFNIFNRLFKVKNRANLRENDSNGFEKNNLKKNIFKIYVYKKCKSDSKRTFNGYSTYFL